MDEATLRLLKQEAQIEDFLRRGSEAWTIVWSDWYNADTNGGFAAALTPTRIRDEVLAEESWRLPSGHPGFAQYYGGRKTARYLRNGIDDGTEPIVIHQDHYGMRPRMLPQISEEFRLYHNLWISPDRKQLYKVVDDGSEHLGAEINDKEVRIRTNLLRQFQAGKRMDLALFVDSVQFVYDPDQTLDLDTLSTSIVEENINASLYVGDHVDGRSRPFSRLLGSKILTPPPRAKAGIWPYEGREEDYPNFIIGEDDMGDPVRFTCDPEELANYFGRNPGAPHYLTPVFFRRQVLQKYFQQPEKFEVTDGYLRCGGLWGLRMDNDHPHHVMVFLGDLGRDLPSSERRYWESFNVAPTGNMSETVFKRSFLGEFTAPEAPDLKFKSLYTRFNDSWAGRFGWRFFKPMHEADAHVLKQLRVPLADSQSEFEAQVRGLAKLLVDALNEAEILAQLPTRVDNEKGLGKLRRWLEQEGYPEADRDVEYLIRLQRLRSKMAAHRKGSDYVSMLQSEGVNDNKVAEVVHLLWNACSWLEAMAQYFEINF